MTVAGSIISGKQYKLVIVGNIPPDWGNDDMKNGLGLLANFNMSLAISQTIAWSNVTFSSVGESFLPPIPNQDPKS